MRKRRALAGAVERLVIGERRLAALDVGRRQRPQRARDLAESQIGEVPLFEILEKTRELLAGQLHRQLWVS